MFCRFILWADGSAKKRLLRNPLRKLIRNSVGNVIIFIVVCAGILLAIGMAALQLAMYFGGAGQLSGAVDAGALTVGKHAATAEIVLAQGDEERFMEYADRTAESVTTTEVNQVLSKALLIQMNEAEMERKGLASAESKDHAAAMIKASQAIAEKLAAKVADSRKWKEKFEQAANSNMLSFLGSSAKIQSDPENGWSTSFVDRGEESNVSFDPQQLPEGFDAATVGIKKGDKYFFKGYEPIKAGDKTLYLVPFKPDGQPHLISAKTFEANTLAKKPLQDWPKPFPNAISCQGKSLTDNKQVFQSRSFAQINPNKSSPLFIGGWVRINFDQNVAHWYVNGSPAEVPNRNEMIGKLGASIGSLLSSTSSMLTGLTKGLSSGLGSLSSSISAGIAKAAEQQQQAKAAQNGNQSGTGSDAGAGAAAGTGGDSPAPVLGGVANIGGSPLLGKPAINKELQDAAKLITDNGAGLSNASHIITDNGTGLISDRAYGLIGEKGSGIVTDNGAGIVTDNGAGVISNDGSSFKNASGVISNDGSSLKNIASVISNDGSSLVGRRSLMSVGDNNNSSNLQQRIDLATKTLQQQQQQLTSMLNNLQNASRQPDNTPHGPETFYGFAPETQGRTFPLGTGSILVQASLGNEYKAPANLYQAICGLGGDYKEMKKVIGQRLRETNPEYKDDDFQKILESCKISTGSRVYAIWYDRQEKKWMAEAKREDSVKSADGFEKEIGRDSGPQDKPNWAIATPMGVGAKPLPSKCTTRSTFFWKPGTGYNGCLGELRIKRETDIYANGIVSLN